MIRKTKRNLTVLFTVTTSILLTILLILSFVFIRSQIKMNETKDFQGICEQIENKVCTDHTLSLDWLNDFQQSNHCLVYIEDNGVRIFPIGVNEGAENCATVFDIVKDKCVRDQIDVSQPSYPFIKTLSPFYSFRHGKGDYLGCAGLLPCNNGWCSFILCQETTSYGNAIRCYLLGFMVMGVVCIVFLFLFCRHFVEKMLRPVVENQKKQKEFIVAASHELRSPLAVIQAAVSLLSLSKGDVQTEPIRDIESEIAHMSRLIDDLLTLATAQSSGWTIEKDEFDVETMLIELYDTYMMIAEKKNIRLNLGLPDESLPLLYADRARIRQVLVILLDNAMSYTPGGGVVDMAGKCKGSSLFLSVADSGIGISDENKKEIFETFYRANASRSDKKHFGLGLSIAKEIVSLHDGAIRVSDTEGGGTTFTVELPLA